MIFKTIVGSQAYGTATPESDVDYKGVYVQDKELLLGFGYKEQVDKGKDECYYEVKRFIELLQSANPTVLEMLFMPQDCIEIIDPMYQLLIDNRHLFLTKKCRFSFGGYAVAQIQKAKGLNKKMNWEGKKIERKTPLDFCYVYYEHKSVPVKKWLKEKGYNQSLIGLTSLPHFRYMYNMFYDHVKDMQNDNPKFEQNGGFKFKGIVQDEQESNDISLSEVSEWYKTFEGLLYFNKDEYSIHCKEYKSYKEWLDKRNTQRYIDVKGHNQQIDGKNLLHCRRLLDMALEIAETGTITVRRPNASELLKIRKGEVDLQTIIDTAEQDIQLLDQAYAQCNLPDEVSPDIANDLLLTIRNSY